MCSDLIVKFIFSNKSGVFATVARFSDQELPGAIPDLVYGNLL